MSLITELKRRNVFRVSVAYLALGWIVTQVTSTVAPMLHLPDWVGPVVLWIGVIGFPFVVMFAWIYELTPEGLKKESEVDRSASTTHVTARRLDYLIVGLLAAAVGLFAVEHSRADGIRGTSEYVVIGLLVLAIALFAIERLGARRREPPLVQTQPAVPRHPVHPADGDEAPVASIAVLPFVNMSSDREQEYFSDGLSEELLNLLAQVPQLRVIARTSSFSFKGKEADVATVARALNVAHVLEGSVRKSGDTLRITAQLVRASDSSHMWSQSYDRRATDVFMVQDEIAGAVVAALRVKLLPTQQVTNPHRTAHAEAYSEYLLGKRFNGRENLDGWRRSVQAYRRAIALDPGFAAAFAALAFAEGHASEYEATAPEIEAGKQRALAAAERAVALAPDLADGYAARGWLRSAFYRDWRGGLADFESALSLGPGSSLVQRRYAALLVGLGRLPEGIEAATRAVELDPLSAWAWNRLGKFCTRAGRIPEARAALTRALDISPESSWASFDLGCFELLQGRALEALQLFRSSGPAWREVGVAMAEHSLGHAGDSQQALDAAIAEHAHTSAYQIAEAMAWRGEVDAAFVWLQRAFEQNDGGLSNIKSDVLLSSIRADPRFAAMLTRMGLPL